MPLPRRILLRIIVTAAILIIIGTLWYIKNHAETQIPALPQASVLATPVPTIGEAVVEQALPNPDFSVQVTEALDIDHLKSYGLPIMIDFGADSCIPCKEMAPVLLDLNTRLQDKAIIRFVDVWKNPKLAEGFPIRVIPTQIFIDSEGNPYRPSDPEASGMLMYVHKDTEDHVFTTHEGGMTEEMIMEALAEMGLHHD